MAVQISIRSVEFNEFRFHYLIYKNVASFAFEELFDGIAELLYNHQASIITNTIHCDNYCLKQFKKAEAKAFDEPNWPTNQLPVPDDNDTVSGMYWGISGLTLKTLSGNNFTTKIFETPETRYCFIGDIAEKNASETINQALLFAGLTSSEIIKNYPANHSSYTAEYAINIVQLFSQHGMWGIRNNNTSIQNFIPDDSSFAGNGQVLTTLNYHVLTLQLVAGKNTTVENLLISVDNLVNEKGFSWELLQHSYVLFNESGQQKEFKNLCKTYKIPLSPLLMINDKQKAEGTIKLVLEFYRPL